jgi:hypothetical protein
VTTHPQEQSSIAGSDPWPRGSSLLEILNGPDEEMRVCAAYVLGRIVPQAEAARPSLTAAIEHPAPGRLARILVGCKHQDPWIRSTAAETLRRIVP